jgi:hypothetical protein
MMFTGRDVSSWEIDSEEFVGWGSWLGKALCPEDHSGITAPSAWQVNSNGSRNSLPCASIFCQAQFETELLWGFENQGLTMAQEVFGHPTIGSEV